MVAHGAGATLASDADRDRVIDVLRAGSAEGRLAPAEFECRVAQARQARTYDQLAELTADLPAGPWAACAPYPDQGVREAGRQPLVSLALTAVIVFVLTAAVTALAIYLHTHGQQFGGAQPGPAHLEPFIQPLRNR